jgi:hypothetical protein
LGGLSGISARRVWAVSSASLPRLRDEPDTLSPRVIAFVSLSCRYRLRPSGGGLRTKSLKLDGWLKLVDDTRLIDGQFTLQDATQCYLWSRMAVIDELKVPNCVPKHLLGSPRATDATLLTRVFATLSPDAPHEGLAWLADCLRDVLTAGLHQVRVHDLH